MCSQGPVLNIIASIWNVCQKKTSGPLCFHPRAATEGFCAHCITSAIENLKQNAWVSIVERKYCYRLRGKENYGKLGMETT